MFRILTLAEIPSVAWKNGLGTTREWIRFPADSVLPFQFRISQAEVASESTFSQFQGYHRTLFLLEGEGMELHHHTGLVQRLHTPGQLANFDGGWMTKPRLIHGPIQDLNLIYRPEVSVTTSVLREGEEWKNPRKPEITSELHRWLFVLSIVGTCQIRRADDEPIPLLKGQLLYGPSELCESIEMDSTPSLTIVIQVILADIA